MMLTEEEEKVDVRAKNGSAPWRKAQAAKLEECGAHAQRGPTAASSEWSDASTLCGVAVGGEADDGQEPAEETEIAPPGGEDADSRAQQTTRPAPAARHDGGSRGTSVDGESTAAAATTAAPGDATTTSGGVGFAPSSIVGGGGSIHDPCAGMPGMPGAYHVMPMPMPGLSRGTNAAFPPELVSGGAAASEVTARTASSMSSDEANALRLRHLADADADAGGDASALLADAVATAVEVPEHEAIVVIEAEEVIGMPPARSPGEDGGEVEIEDGFYENGRRVDGDGDGASSGRTEQEESTDKGTGRSKKRRHWILALLLLAVAVGLVVGLAVGLGGEYAGAASAFIDQGALPPVLPNSNIVRLTEISPTADLDAAPSTPGSAGSGAVIMDGSASTMPGGGGTGSFRYLQGAVLSLSIRGLRLAVCSPLYSRGGRAGLAQVFQMSGGTQGGMGMGMGGPPPGMQPPNGMQPPPGMEGPPAGMDASTASPSDAAPSTTASPSPHATSPSSPSYDEVFRVTGQNWQTPVSMEMGPMGRNLLVAFSDPALDWHVARVFASKGPPFGAQPGAPSASLGTSEDEGSVAPPDWDQVGPDIVGDTPFGPSLGLVGSYGAILSGRDGPRIYRRPNASPEGPRIEDADLTSAQINETPWSRLDPVVGAEEPPLEAYADGQPPYGSWPISVASSMEIRVPGTGRKQRFAVGYPREAGGRGIVRVYEYARNGTSYRQIGEDLIGTNPGDGFGRAVSCDIACQVVAVATENGNYVRAFVLKDDDDDDAQTGYYEQIGGTIWGQKEDEGRFGASLECGALFENAGACAQCPFQMDGARIIVGSPGYNGGRGRAVIYQYAASSALGAGGEPIWHRFSQDITVVSDDKSPQSLGLGSSVTISPDQSIVAVGTGLTDSSAPGKVLIFELNHKRIS